MRRLALLPFGVLMILATLPAIPAAADHPGSATTGDLRQLQDELDSLDDALLTLEPGHPRYQELKDRAEEIREGVIALRFQVRRHERNPDRPGPLRDDVEDLRRDITALRIDLFDSLEAEGSEEGRLDAGTEIQVRLEQSLSSRTARMEDRFEATVVRDVRVDGRLVIPTSSRVRGIVRAAEPAERPVKAGRLELTFDTLTLPRGSRMDIRTSVISIKEDIDRSDTAKKAGMGALLGAVLGRVVGGGTKGALIGLVVGGAGGIVASKGDDVELPEGTVLTLRLERPLTVRR
jgi:hypothetical protein